MFSRCFGNRTTTYVDLSVKEGIEIQLHPENFSRYAGFILNHT